ncbi:hypothetical protein Baya_12423 [Bagarius yarrelli]|uniref:Uncharacterized protein n=1 Tax=Bagarius yarrelli TaxID=175774 RepID=A0A556V2Y1_BAGYA|nr:hypothetical protein Baya_12423 [Bagarius yarrelli]
MLPKHLPYVSAFTRPQEVEPETRRTNVRNSAAGNRKILDLQREDADAGGIPSEDVPAPVRFCFINVWGIHREDGMEELVLHL